MAVADSKTFQKFPVAATILFLSESHRDKRLGWLLEVLGCYDGLELESLNVCDVLVFIV
jgi:hypothetical protein